MSCHSERNPFGVPKDTFLELQTGFFQNDKDSFLLNLTAIVGTPATGRERTLNHQHQKMKNLEHFHTLDPRPKLTVVGAGPGDPDLITVKAIKALKSADVVLYDALIADELLDYCKPDTEKIYVGKRPGESHSQDAINFMIVEKAYMYGHVVRLKGGDPFIFGRGMEEIEYAKNFGLETAYIPGISSSVAAAGYAGIPLTARGVSESFWVITGTKTDGSLSQDLEIALQTTATIVILMGMSKLAQIAEICESLGKENLPVAIIQNGTTERQKVGVGIAKNLKAIAEENDLVNPAVIVLGEVVKYASVEEMVGVLREWN